MLKVSFNKATSNHSYILNYLFNKKCNIIYSQVLLQIMLNKHSLCPIHGIFLLVKSAVIEYRVATPLATFIKVGANCKGPLISRADVCIDTSSVLNFLSVLLKYFF